MQAPFMNSSTLDVLGPVPPSSNGSAGDIYLFDLDVLSTSRRARMDDGFAQVLTAWARKHPCYLVTSHNYQTVLSVVPQPLRHAMRENHASSGTEVWQNDASVRHHDHPFRDSIYEFLAQVVRRSSYEEKRAPLLDSGPACLRIDIAGHKATAAQRKAYLEWETGTRERAEIISEFAIRYPDYQICQNGETGILITHKDYSPNTVVQALSANHPDGRILGYFSPMSACGYAAAMADSLEKPNMFAEIAGPSDLAQLLKYEERRQQKSEIKVPAPFLEDVGA
ncbi:hypothetical protein [Roseibium sp. RKSG952]|uniref:hypothetical protein n=1 Tax=Roseibium sp. RKSG952 TaxID=2529384 RepID=UPI0012BCCF14|nr:hypothetical protein [Roseibium sp. RKSG952]MTH99856.1 hypothetical protein [Roseibium sp. RKSG952]